MTDLLMLSKLFIMVYAKLILKLKNKKFEYSDRAHSTV